MEHVALPVGDPDNRQRQDAQDAQDADEIRRSRKRRSWRFSTSFDAYQGLKTERCLET